MQVILDQTFQKNDTIAPGEYAGCTFRGLDLSRADLSGFVFTECAFEGCDLSLASLMGTALREVRFRGCKMFGLRFELCNPVGFSPAFEDCLCDNCSFYEVKLKKAVLRNVRLREAYFADCDLTGAVLDGCDLTGAVFGGTGLEKADLRTAWGYSIDPAANRIRGARFAYPAVLGLLEAYGIDVE